MRRLLLAIALFIAALPAGAAGAWAGRPPAAPPVPAQASGPPPAWLDTSTTAAWFDYGSYCWRTGCADYIPPAQRPGLREISLAKNAVVRMHFGFAPKSVIVRFVSSRKAVRLPPSRVVTWTVKAAGVISVEVRGAGGSASYVIRLRLH